MNFNIVFRQLLVLAILALGSAAYAQDIRAAESEQLDDVATPKSVAFVLEGSVHSAGGAPAIGAIVVSTAGGQAITDEHGEYRLETRVACEAKSLQVTAVGGVGGKLVASTQVALSGATASASVPPLQLASTSGCTPSWLPTFGGEPGTNGTVNAMTVFDDGNGPALYAGGEFTSAGGVLANNIVKWDGSDWTALGSGVNAGSSIYVVKVNALVVFDDGNGPSLYVGGNFQIAGGLPANGLAKWDGSSWSALGSGPTFTPEALLVFDDGNGDQLFAGGKDASTNTTANVVAKWDGANWVPLGSGMSNNSGAATVFALAEFDDGTGPALYAGGKFTEADGLPVKNLVKWDGSGWSDAGSGTWGYVLAMTVFDDGTGNELFVAGRFTDVGDPHLSVGKIAKWDGSTWTALAMGLGNGPYTIISALEVFDDGGGEALFACGQSLISGTTLINGIAKWDGQSWTELNGGIGDLASKVNALAVFDDGNGSALYGGGVFSNHWSAGARNIAKWDGSDWSALGSGLSGRTLSLVVFDDGGGDALFVGGFSLMVAGVTMNSIAKWDGSSWTSLGSGMDAYVSALCVFDDGTGDALFAGGAFTTAGGVSANGVAKWDGSSWSALRSGLTAFPSVRVFALAVFDDGGGPALFAGGRFETAGGVPVSNIAKWDGSNWTPLGSGVGPLVVQALAVFNDGNGERLFAGGKLNLPGASPTYIEKWDGSNWAPLGSGVDGPVTALTVFDDGLGAALYVGGGFLFAGALPVNRLAKWDGLNWAPVGGGVGDPLSPGTSATVSAMQVFDDGSGSALAVAGSFLTAGGLAAGSVAKWDGSGWAALGSGTNGVVRALAEFDSGGGAALYAGGLFTSVIDSGDSYLGVWGCPFGIFTDFCNGDGGDGLGCTQCPCGNEEIPGTIGGCLNSASTSAQLFASGYPSVSLPPGRTHDLRLALRGTPAGAFCILNSGDALAPANPTNPCFGLGSGVPALAFDGLRCAVVNTRRHGGRSADSNGDIGVTNSPWGGEGGPPVGIANAGGGFAAGQTRYFQVIYRDDPLAVCMRGLNTSQAVEVVFEPQGRDYGPVLLCFAPAWVPRSNRPG